MAAVRRSTFRKNEAHKPKADDKKRFPRGESRKRTKNDEKCRVQERDYRSIPGIFLCPLPAAMRRSFSAFCRLTPTHDVFCRRLFASGSHTSFIFSFLPPDAYARRFLSSTFRFQLWIVAHFQLFAACRLRTSFFVVDFSLSAAARRSFSAFCRLMPTYGVFRRWLFASGCGASFIFSLLPPDAYAWRFLSSTFRFRQLRVVHFQLFTA